MCICCVKLFNTAIAFFFQDTLDSCLLKSIIVARSFRKLCIVVSSFHFVQIYFRVLSSINCAHFIVQYSSKSAFQTTYNKMATSQQDVDWQSTKKTVLERSRHMFNNPFMSDVKFSCEDSDKEFFAHKYVLATSSAVFYAMFYGELAEKNSVHMKDTNEEGLQEFLRFLYTDECNLSTDNAVFVLYLAKKYIVLSLAQKCIEFLEANLGVENAITVVQQAIQFDEKKLEKKCWDVIDLKTSEAIATDVFTDINQQTLAELLKRESLNVKELDLFKAVLKWSEAECSRKGIEANAKNKRAVVGNAIYQIRFASMTPQEFAENASQSGILTPEEVILFYDVISGVKRASEKWNMSERKAKGEVLLRCCRFASYKHRPVLKEVIPSENTLCVSFSKAVKIHGVHLLGNKGDEYDVKLQVFSQSVEKKLLLQQNNRFVSGFDVMLPVPINVQADVVVHLKATITGVFTRCTGCKGKNKVETNGLTVNFFNTPGEHFGETSVDQGQFDEIIFSKI